MATSPRNGLSSPPLRWKLQVLLLFLLCSLFCNETSGLASRMPRLSPASSFVPPPDEVPPLPAEPEPRPPPRQGMHELVFLGTGCSSATPHLHCLLGTRGDLPGPCAVCRMAMEGDPRENRNHRGNPSLLLRVRAEQGGQEDEEEEKEEEEEAATTTTTTTTTTTNTTAFHVVIDAGKTFREAAQRWLPFYVSGYGGLDAVVITHEHADAILGIDDLRSVQKKRPGTPAELPIFLSAQCHAHVRGVFPYLMPRSRPSNQRMFVASLDWRVLDERLSLRGLGLEEGEEADDAAGGGAESGSGRRAPRAPPLLVPFDPVPGLRMDAFAVEHGPGFMSLGFAFGPASRRTVYISDVSRLPPATLEAMKPPPSSEDTSGSSSSSSSGGGSFGWRIETLIVDCLDPGPNMYPSHFSLPQSLEVVRHLRPKRTLLVGMSHRFEHYVANRELALLKEEEGLDVQLAYDGQCIEIAATTSAIT